MQLTLDSEGGVSIRSTTASTVEFFQNHSEDHDLSLIAGQILDTVVQCLGNCMTAQAGRRDTSAVLEYLRGMEQRQKLVTHECASDAVEKINGRLNTVQASVDSMSGLVAGQMMTLITTVDNTVRASVQKLDVGNIAAQVSSCVRDWLQAEVDGLKEGQLSTADVVKGLEGRVRDIVCHSVSEPQLARHEHLLGMLHGLPAQVSILCVKAADDKENSASDRVADKVAEMRVRLDEAVVYQAREVLEARIAVNLVTEKVQHMIDDAARMWADSKERSLEQKSASASNLGQVPGLLKVVLAETFKEFEAQSYAVKALICGTQQHLVKIEKDLCESLGALQVVRKGNDDVSARVEALAQQLTVSKVKAANNNSEKGKLGELKLFDFLSEKLTVRDGYSVEAVHGTAHACDILVQRLGYPDVRVESKFHGNETGSAVRTKECTKFEGDLLATGNHGVFVSHCSKITGRGRIELVILSGCRIAVYLSEVFDDLELVTDMVLLVYKIDTLLQAANGGGAGLGNINITTETMNKIQLQLTDFAIKVQATKGHLKEAISLLDDLAFDRISSLLLGKEQQPKSGLGGPSLAPEKMVLTCSHCSYTCVRSFALENHIKAKHASN